MVSFDLLHASRAQVDDVQSQARLVPQLRKGHAPVTDTIKGPAREPCPSCPYRKDVPPGVWAASEYEKLTQYDLPTDNPSVAVFMCHQLNSRICAGWAGCHDMDETIALRIAVMQGVLSVAEQVSTLEYQSPVPLFASGTEAALHGMSGIEAPSEDANKIVLKILRKRYPGRY